MSAMSAMDCALAAIDFERRYGPNRVFKRRVRFTLQEPDHPRVAARYGARAQLLAGRSLGAAIETVERWYADERKAFQVAHALGRATRLPLIVLAELRLILRWMRAKGLHTSFPTMVTEIRRRAA